MNHTVGQVSAWYMQVDRTSRVAVGQQELVHIVSDPDYIDVPQSPDYCKRVILVNNRIVPVIDISMLTNNTSSYHQHNAVAVAMYMHRQKKTLCYGGIQLTDMPQLKTVSNDMAAKQQDMQDKWRHICFSGIREANNEIIPVVNLSYLFSSELIASGN